MIGESKPNFALDLSNEGVALWHRSSGGGWKTLGSVSLSDPNFTAQLAALRNIVVKGVNRPCRAVVRIPRSEVLLSKVRVGVYEGEAAIRHAQKQIAEMSPYEMDAISYDLGDKGVGNMAPVGIVARQTLTEAEAFAKSNGFTPLYFTTQYAEREFDREPRFYLTEAKAAAKPLWFVPWVAAASVGLAIGYFGYSYLITPGTSQPTPTAAVEEQPVSQTTVATVPEPTPEPEPQPAVNTAQLGLQDVAPALPNVATTINPPQETTYPEMLVASIALGSETIDPVVARLLPTEAALPAVAVSSKQVKTSDLQIAEARRDLPDVSVNDEIVSIIQADMSILPLDAPQPATPIQLASLTTPDQQLNATLLTRLPSTLSSDGIVNDATKQTAARPVRPPSPITAEPGTLTPTVEGTPGPEYITIYAGRPANEPRNRIDPLPPELELAGFRPRLRPDTLNVPAELLAAVEPEVVAEPTILDLADPALRPLRARLRPDTLVVLQPVLAETEVEPEAAPETETEVAVEDTTPEAIQEPTLLALADPALRPLRARLRPEALSARAQTIVAQQEIAVLGDPAMRIFRARLRPDTLVVPEIETTVTAVEEPATEEPVAQETEAAEPTDLAALVENAITQAGTETPEDTTDVIAAAIAQDSVVQAIQNEAAVLSFADPTLRPFRARTRPANLVPAAQLASLTTDGAQTQTDTGTSLLALADPTLSGVRARTRPGNLRVITPTEQSSLLSLADPSLAGKRTRARPRNLRIIAPEPAAIEPAVEPEIEDIVAPAERVINGTKQAVAISPKPKVRPRKLARVVQRVTREAARTNTTVRNDSGSDGTRTGVSTNGSTRATAKLPKSARGTVKSAPPVNATVARAATEKSRFKKSRMNVVGIFGAPNKRRALIRLPTGRYVKVQNGDKVGGWKVSAIGESSIRIKKGNRDQVLRIP